MRWLKSISALAFSQNNGQACLTVASNAIAVSASAYETPENNAMGVANEKILANELAKDIKTEKDLCSFTSELVKLTIEAALGSEMEHHLGYAKHALQGYGTFPFNITHYIRY